MNVVENRGSWFSLTVVVGAAVAAGFTVARGGGLLLAAFTVIAVVAWFNPALLLAVLIVGTGILHAISSLFGGIDSRAEVIASPIVAVPILAAIVLPPLVRVFLRNSRTFWRVPHLERGQGGRILVVGLLIFGAFVALRSFSSPAPVYAATKTSGFWLFAIGPTLFGLVVLRSRDDAARVIRASIILGGVWLTTALVSAALAGNLDLRIQDPGELFGGRGQTAGGIGLRAAIVAVLSIGMFGFREVAGTLRLLTIGTACLATAVVVFANHVGSMLALAAGLGTLLSIRFLGRRRRSGAWLLLTLIVLGGALAAWQAAPGTVAERLDDPLASPSFTGRLALQTRSLEAWLEAPILGHGTGATARIGANRDISRFGAVEGIYPHNLTLEVLAEGGLVGLALMTFPLVVLMLKTIRGLRRRHPASGLIGTMLGALVVGLVAAQGTGDLTLHNEIWIMGAVLAVGLGGAVGEPVEGPSRSVAGLTPVE